jgi:hypothetical protein
MLEHSRCYGVIDRTREKISAMIDHIENVIYLHDNILLINDTILIATNGWCTFDFAEAGLDTLLSTQDISFADAEHIIDAALIDHGYLQASVNGLQKANEVKQIMVVTNAVPLPGLVYHDTRLSQPTINLLGSLGLSIALDADYNKKVSTWIFGRYSGDMDLVYDGIRFVNNTCSNIGLYYPKRLEVSVS